MIVHWQCYAQGTNSDAGQRGNLLTFRDTGVAGAETDCFFFCVSFAASNDGQATAAPVSLSATADCGISGEAGCRTTHVVSFLLTKSGTQSQQQYDMSSRAELTIFFHAGFTGFCSCNTRWALRWVKSLQSAHPPSGNT
jgi:hypothetical protein